VRFLAIFDKAGRQSARQRSPHDFRGTSSSYVQCVVCENAIKGGKWFARIKHGDWMVALCCPLCTEAFETNPQAYIRRIETLAQLRNLQGPFKQETVNE